MLECNRSKLMTPFASLDLNCPINSMIRKKCDSGIHAQENQEQICKAKEKKRKGWQCGQKTFITARF
jgi:hypothetical protein